MQPSDFPLLHSEFQKDDRTKVLRANDYQQLKSQLPPSSRRGLILIDQPYEMKTDYQDVVAFRKAISASPPAAMQCSIRVVMRQQQIKRMLRELEATGGIRPAFYK